MKLEKYRDEKLREEEERDRKRMEELMKIDLIEAEKRRLIQEHAPYLEGFLHPNLITEAKKLKIPALK